jgi:hypothetical protein
MKHRIHKRKGANGVSALVEWRRERLELCSRRLAAYQRKIAELERQARDLI